MGGYLLRRFVQAPIVLLVISALTFFIIRLSPGDPFAGERGIDPAIQQARAERYGFDKPLVIQYGLWLKNVSTGDRIIHSSIKIKQLMKLSVNTSQSIALGSLALLLACLVESPRV